MNTLIWSECGFRVFLTPAGDLVDHDGFALSPDEEASVQACLNYKSAD